ENTTLTESPSRSARCIQHTSPACACGTPKNNSPGIAQRVANDLLFMGSSLRSRIYAGWQTSLSVGLRRLYRRKPNVLAQCWASSGASPESAQPALGGSRPARPCTAWIENGFSAIADPEIAHRDQFVVFVYQRAANAQPRRHARLLEQVAQFARVRIAGGFDPFAAATEVDGQRRVEHRRPCCCRVHGFEPQPA